MSNPSAPSPETSPALIANTVHEVDATVVGMGVLGLMIAKRLVDFGQRVAVIEQSSTLADGPSIKNHGWLHTGTAHSLSVADPTKARALVDKLQYGHRFFTSYAPECLAEPFIPTYAVTRDPLVAERARETWGRHGVPHKELNADQFSEVEPGIDPTAASFFFRAGDSRINNRLLFAKLFTDIRRGGAVALTGARYEYEDNQTIRVSSAEGESRVVSPLYFYATGTGLGNSYEKLTGESLGMEWWKSHLLFLPRITNVSVIHLDRNSPIIINHGNVSVVNRSYDEVPVTSLDSTIDREEVERAFEVVSSHYPRAYEYAADVRAVACLKPHIKSDGPVARHDVGEVIFQPREGHLFALPGKMTEAPYVADSLVQSVHENINLSPISQRPIETAANFSQARVG